jgi:hypothetical protein
MLQKTKGKLRGEETEVVRKRERERDEEERERKR